MMDVIDKSRANREYLDLLKEMKMNQRVSYIEKWLLSKEWKTNEIRKVRNIHFVGKLEKEIFNRVIMNLSTHAITVSGSENFEKLYEPGFNRVEKAVEFLKWKKEKVRLDYNKLIKPGEIEVLFENEVKYGVQMKVNSFIIWKYTLKWSICAEIAMFSGVVLFGNLKSKKKRRKMEMLINIIQKSGLKFKIKLNKLYVLDKNSLKFLMQFVGKGKKRKKEIIVMMEKEFELRIEKISKNWKSRKKKPPDKLVDIDFVSLNKKEFNCMKINKAKRRGRTKFGSSIS
jgi:hypothetical protein